MDNQNTWVRFLYWSPKWVLILVLMDNQNTSVQSFDCTESVVLILVLMDNQNTYGAICLGSGKCLNPCSNG